MALDCSERVRQKQMSKNQESGEDEKRFKNLEHNYLFFINLIFTNHNKDTFSVNLENILTNDDTVVYWGYCRIHFSFLCNIY